MPRSKRELQEIREAVLAEKTQAEKTKDAVLEKLAELGGQQLTDDNVVREGNRLILPASMTPRDAMTFLGDYIKREETETQFSKTFRYRPWDGAAALQRALIKVTGTTGIGKSTLGFFGKNPPELRTIQIGFGKETQVPWGMLAVPMFEGQMMVSGTNDRTWGPLFVVSISAPRKYRAHIEGLWKVIEEELKAFSIYKGQAIDGQTDPEFIDLSGVDPEKVIYSDETTEQLEANIWSVLRHTDVMRELKLPRKRAVLLEGTYGTGKTLAAFLTAQVAIENNWTFLYCRPSRDDFKTVMQTARLYQPAVVFFEDVDTMSQTDEQDRISLLLDLFDGITAKGTEIMVVLTTNHKEKIHKGMIRPGRLDAMIHIGALDRHGVQRMIESLVPADVLDENLAYEEIYAAMVGFLPAFVKEAVDRTMRYAIARDGGVPTNLTTEDFVGAAKGLRPQLELMEGAKEGIPSDSLSVALRREVVSAIDNTPILDRDDDHVLTLTTGESNGH